MPPIATIGIATKDRRGELRQALRSAVAQHGDVEVVVVDDGSTDGTPEMVETEFPQVRLIRHEASAGYIPRRNEIARTARAPIVISIDDDAELSDPSIAGHTARLFDDPRVGVVAIPYIEAGRGETHVNQLAPDADRVWLAEKFIGTAHALRTDAFLALGGYREELVRNVEELDYALRLLNTGRVVRLGTGAPILHHESPRRHRPHIVAYDTRNNVLHGVWNVPFPYVLVRLAKVAVFHLLAVSRYSGLPRAVVEGLATGAKDAVRTRHLRRPVSRHVYRLSHRIRNAEPPLPLEAVVTDLPPLGAP